MALFQLTAFGIGAALISYLIPGRFRWILLLAASLGFYCSRSLEGLPFLLLTTLTTYCAALLIEKIGTMQKTDVPLSREEKKQRKATIRKKQHRILSATVILNFAILGVLKYTDDLLGLLNQSPLDLLLPLGISFYTFQSIGYLFDVANGKIKAEKNLMQYALFVSFFPQIIQGPIGRYDKLSPQLREPKPMNLNLFVRGLLRILWGLFKKMVIADRAMPFVSAVFDSPSLPSGSLSLVAVLLYAAQQYCDFSGGIDLVSGIAELFGISLAENFKRPYFSISLADFWRRWHISLGNWMRDYVFYPFALSRPVSRLSKALKNKNTSLSRTLPAALGNLLVFFLVGLWHGATTNYLLWGLYNGIILAVSSLLEPFYKTHALPSSKAFHVLRILRTFIIVNIGWFFDRSTTGGKALAMIASLVTRWEPLSLDLLAANGLPGSDLLVILIACAVLFVVSLLTETGWSIRDRLIAAPIPVRWLVLLLGFACVLVFGIWGSGFNESSFIYLQF